VRQKQDTFFLPDFCNVRMVFAVVVIGELLAFTFTLSPFKTGGDRWSELSIISLFIQWVGLSSAALLCIARKWLSTINEKWAATLSYLIILVTTAILSEATFWITREYSLQINPPDWHVDLIIRNVSISAIVSAIALRYFYVQHQWKQKIQAESQARIQALQARIRPHFLFNSMNTIASLTRTQPELAEEAVEDLADLFRQSLADARHMVSIEEELELCNRYLRIEKLRMGDRLNISWQIDTLPKDALIPALSIQPLLENAIYHGVEPFAQGGTIEVHGTNNAGFIDLSVKNPLPAANQTKQRNGNKMALDNIKHRLEAYYDAKGKLQINYLDSYFIVKLIFPYLRAAA
jgi:two-component system sensor histidine kinase AlgZ